METVKQGVDQKLVEGQEKLHQMWLSWNQKQLQGTEGDPGKPEVAMVGGGERGVLASSSTLLLDGPTNLPGTLTPTSLPINCLRDSLTPPPGSLPSGCGCCL